MAGEAEAIVARARACIGARFRPQGRDPAHGLDCVGLVAVALNEPAVPKDYALRCSDAKRLGEGLRAAGLVRVAEPGMGDVLLLRIDSTQLHLAIRTPDGIVHADAGLRKIVERPGLPAWPLLSAWRQTASTKGT
jgi:murein DD-endopeptidase / murein LD-carboxypeptidase